MIVARLEGTKGELELFLELFPIHTENVTWLDIATEDGSAGVLFRVDFNQIEKIHNAILKYGMRHKNNSVLKDMAAEKVMLYREQGKSFHKIAVLLNEQGYTTGRGKSFKAMTVKRLYDQGKENVT